MAEIIKTSIDDFISTISKADGFARTARFAVHITMPVLNIGSIGRQLNLHCDSVSMPGHDLQAQDVQHGSAPGRMMVQSHDFAGTVGASFYLDSRLNERRIFETWQSMCVNNSTHKAHYYDDYIGEMEIYQLDGNNEPVYGIKLTEVYPNTIGAIEYSYANASTIAKLNVEFQYRQWMRIK